MADEVDKKGELYAAIARAMANVGVIGKTGTNAYHKYSYATDADVARASSRALAAEGLTSPMPIEVSTAEIGEIGKTLVYSFVITWLVGHKAGGSITLQTVGSCLAKSGDKAPYVATTGARKAVLTQLLCLERSDDPEAVRETKEAGKAEAPPFDLDAECVRLGVTKVALVRYLDGIGKKDIPEDKWPTVIRWVDTPAKLAAVRRLEAGT